MSDNDSAKLDALNEKIDYLTQNIEMGVRENREGIKELRLQHKEDVAVLHTRVNETREQVDEHNTMVMSAINDLRQDAIRAQGKPWMWLVLIIGMVAVSGMINWMISMLTKGTP